MARPVSMILSNWHHHFEGLRDSSQRFYQELEAAIQQREIPDIKISRVFHREGGPMSAMREYLRIYRKEHLFDICAAPFGKQAFFISWWLGESPGCIGRVLMATPLIGPIIYAIIKPDTYFRLDTAMMFQEAVHAAVMEVVDGTTKAQGLRMLTDDERKPILKDLFRR